MLTPLIQRILLAFGAISFFFVALNLLTDRSNFWAVWPIWALSMLTGAACGALFLRRHRFLGFWLGGGFFLIAGLAGIDIRDGGNWWCFWPAGAWFLLSLIFIGVSVDLLSTVPTSHPVPEDDHH